jgi:hypothetical protein
MWIPPEYYVEAANWLIEHVVALVVTFMRLYPHFPRPF